MNLYEFEYDNGNIAEIEAKSEAEAIKAFKKMDIDYLVINNYIV